MSRYRCTKFFLALSTATDYEPDDVIGEYEFGKLTGEEQSNFKYEPEDKQADSQGSQSAGADQAS